MKIYGRIFNQVAFRNILLTVFLMTQGKLQEYQMNAIQMYKFKLSKIQCFGKNIG